MAPGNPKRKRPDRGFSNDDGYSRPSPHRPETMGMAQDRANGYNRGGRGGTYRRQSRHNTGFDNTETSVAPTPPKNTASQTAPVSQNDDTSILNVTARDDVLEKMDMQTQEIVEESTQEPSSPPTVFANDFLTDEVLRIWAEGGRKSTIEASSTMAEIQISTLLQELVHFGLNGQLDPAECGDTIREIIEQHDQDGATTVRSLFLDTISLLEDTDTQKSRLTILVTSTKISPDVIRMELDVPLLQSLSLVRSSFAQMKTRKTTNLLYRQANFNLLREESEGYAKLLTEYFNTAQEASSNRDLKPTMAEDAVQRIKALVGSFDLDVGRVLDITLDISANLLVKAYGFFIKFYLNTPWWPDMGSLDNVQYEDEGYHSLPQMEHSGQDTVEYAGIAHSKRVRDERFWERVQISGMDAFYDISARRIVDFDSINAQISLEVEPQLDSRGREVNEDKRKRINESRKFMRETRTLPPRGNSDAAQLLGFKLRFYASAVREPQDALPENLIALAALLIKIGFISLRDLYPHLYPPDDKMGEERSRLEREKTAREAKERPGGGLNALAMSGALPDDTVPAVRNLRNEKDRSGGSTPKQEKKDEEESPEQLPPPDNQKIMLLKALLLIGALPEALYILGRFPWLAELDPTIPQHLHRIVRHMLSSMADFVRPLKGREDMDQAKEQLADTSQGPNGRLKFLPRPGKKPVRWLGLDKVDEKDGQEFRFYYADWADNIPICQSVEDVVLLCNTFLAYLGVKIGQDPEILGTLARIAKKSLQDDNSDENRSRWLELMKRLLVPALSLSKHNPGLTQEIFELLLLFPMTTRYNIYAEWYLGRTSRLPEMRVALAYNRAEVKDVLRRVTNETGKKYARALAKVSYASPGIVMMYMISQLESYSNMIPALVDCTRFFSAMAYDVLTWCLINSLSGRGKDRMQADGMLTSPWLQALSQFVASLFARYPALNPAPVLQYLASELRTGNSTDLEMFEQVLAEMAGIKADLQFNDAQVQAMAGGDHLQSIIMQQLGDTRHTHKSTAKRLIRSLTEPGLIGQLLIAVAQERQMYQHHQSSSDMPLKVLGNNVDKIHQVLTQYLDVLRTNLKPDEFEATVPDVMSLVGDFGLEPGIAFTLCRAVISFRVAEYDEAKRLEETEEKKRRQATNKAKTNGEVSTQDLEEGSTAEDTTVAASLEDSHPKTDSEQAEQSQPNDQNMSMVAATSTTVAETVSESPWHPVLEPIIRGMRHVNPQLESKVSPPFYVTFWTLAQSDVVVFTESYTQEIDRLSRQIALQSPDSRHDSSATIKEKERKKKSLQEASDNLRAEVKSRVASYSKVSNRLSHREKAHWFDPPTSIAELVQVNVALLQECFIPRSMLSAVDAHYSFLMIRLLHDKGTPNFNTMTLFAQLFKKQALAALIFQCTALEAQNFGRFLLETLKLLSQWHSEKATYEKEAIGLKTKLPGMTRVFEATDSPEFYLDYENFRRLVTNWHTALCSALQACFETGEYSHIRNGIIVLKAVSSTYPALTFHGKSLLSLVMKLSQEENRQDLKLMALSLVGPLKTREKKWIAPQDFRHGEVRDNKAGNKSASTGPPTAPLNHETPRLDATAPDFTPSTSHEAIRKESIAGVEDGEVEEEKQNAAAAAERTTELSHTKLDPSEDHSRATELQSASGDVRGDSRPGSRATNPSQTSTSLPAAPNSTRAASMRSTAMSPNANARTGHALPSRPERPERPEAPPVPKSLPAPVTRAGERTPNRHNESRSRDERQSDVRSGPKDRSPGRGRGRTPPSGEATRSGPSRDERTPQRHGRDDLFSAPRRDAHLSNVPSHSPAPPANRDRPIASVIESSATGLPHPDRANLIGSAIVGANPQHANRLSSSFAQPASAPITPDSQHHENPARMAQINGDLREKENAQPRPESRHNMRPENPRQVASRMNVTNDLAPTGPRSGRLSRHGADMDHRDPSYGRLNNVQDVPSGLRNTPNGPSSRGPRNFTPTQGTYRLDNEGPSSIERESDSRHTGPHQPRRQPSMSSMPTTPMSEGGPALGVHPERLARLTETSSTAVHSANQSNNPGENMSPSTPAGPRSGPRGPPPANSMAPVLPPNGPPSGPARRNDRGGRGDIATINATLQNANGRDVSFRGAAQSRQGSVAMPAVAPMQSIASPMEPPVRRDDEAFRQDKQHNANMSRSQPRSELTSRNSQGDMRDGGRLPRRDDGAQYGSRNASRERRPNDRRNGPMTPGEDGRDQRRDDRRGKDENHHQNPYGGTAPKWPYPQDNRNPNEDGRRGPRLTGRGGDDFRAARHDEDRRGFTKPEGVPDGRKRRFEDSHFDPSKRRRSGQQ